MSKTAKVKAEPALNKTPGGSFSKDPVTGKLTRIESTKRVEPKATAAEKAVEKVKE